MGPRLREDDVERTSGASTDLAKKNPLRHHALDEHDSEADWVLLAA
jgi:hypothetical protein